MKSPEEKTAPSTALSTAPSPVSHVMGVELPADVIESLLAIGPVEWGQTFCQSDEKHVDDFRDTLRITREHFGIEAKETTISYVALDGTGTVLATTGMSPNSPQHSRILAAAWNQLVEIAKATYPSPQTNYPPQSEEAR